MSYSRENIVKGLMLEDPVKSIFKSEGFYIAKHSISQGGVDIEAFNGRRHIVIECLNWYGGYIHDRRWKGIIDNLMSHPDTERVLICAGVAPTKRQNQLAKMSRVKVIRLPKQMAYPLQFIDLIIKGLGLGVITSTATLTASSHRFFGNSKRKISFETFWRFRKLFKALILSFEPNMG